jgi:NAD(P)-dependent dehydrogenase (short-subunit alcohol dehydrogenase family)
MFTLTNKIAVITGAGSGIGQAIARLFAQQGATVHLPELQAATATQTLQEIEAAGYNGNAYSCDITDALQVEAVMQAIGAFDILVNCAGIAHVGTATNTTAQDFDRVYQVNVKGTYHCLHYGIPLMQQRGGGVILNVASIAALTGIPDRFAYSMSKGAIHAITMSVARDYLSHNIRCNSISPARVHTPFVDGFIAKNYPGREEEMFQKLAASQPMGRMGHVTEIAQLALYLCSDAASFISGNDYPIDGGFIHLSH